MFLILIFSSLTIKLFNTKMTLDEDEIYGNYVIDRNKCAGEQANWQYNHYRFKITKEKKMFFYVTENNTIKKTFIKDIELNHGHSSPLLDFNTMNEQFHILEKHPTLYRENWSFYYVFYSKKYGNMFFTKDNYKSED